MATLYRCTTPTNWLCPCGKVARALKRDGIPFTEVVVPQRRSRRPEVEALTDQRRVPVLVIDGDAICDSRRIVEHLEWRRQHAAARAPEALTPPDGGGRSTTR
jgi:glutathione S-transferase